MERPMTFDQELFHGGSVSEADLNSHAIYVQSILGSLIVRIIEMGKLPTISDLNYLSLVGEIESP
jgi:hypothetical protein